MSEFLESLGLGPMLLYLGVAWGTLLMMVTTIWEIVLYIGEVVFEKLCEDFENEYAWA